MLIRIPLCLLALLALTVTKNVFANNQFAPIDLVKVDKSARTMYLLAENKVIKSYHIALGQSPKGHKVKEGDSKTPEGKYVLDYKKEDSQFYRAMHINYPNATDIAKAHLLGVDPGGFIMVHGQRSGDRRDARRRQRFNWTDGCIALTNAEMDEFMTLVETGTPIHIEW